LQLKDAKTLPGYTLIYFSRLRSDSATERLPFSRIVFDVEKFPPVRSGKQVFVSWLDSRAARLDRAELDEYRRSRGLVEDLADVLPLPTPACPER
jgi:hypothetical protein